MKKIKVISLKNCPYSEAAEDMLKNNNIAFTVTKVNTNTKKKYKSKLIDTFPQIYLDIDKKPLLLGGYNELKNIYDIVNKTSNIQKILNNLNKILSKKWSRKHKLRLIQTININLPN